MNQKESRKRLLILLLSYIGLLAMLGGYVIAYFGYYYPVIIRHDTKLYFKGHLLIFAFYLVVLFLSLIHISPAATGLTALPQQPSYIIKQSPPDSNILLFVGKIVNCNEEN